LKIQYKEEKAMCSIKAIITLEYSGRRVNISSLEKENISGELTKREYNDGLELKPEADKVERVFVTDKGLIIKILKIDPRQIK